MEHEDCLSVNLCLACPPQFTAGPIHTHCALYDIEQDGTILGDLVTGHSTLPQPRDVSDLCLTCSGGISCLGLNLFLLSPSCTLDITSSKDRSARPSTQAGSVSLPRKGPF